MQHIEFIAQFLTVSGPAYNQGDRALVSDEVAVAAIAQGAARAIKKDAPNKQVKQAPASK